MLIRLPHRPRRTLDAIRLTFPAPGSLRPRLTALEWLLAASIVFIWSAETHPEPACDRDAHRVPDESPSRPLSTMLMLLIDRRKCPIMREALKPLHVSYVWRHDHSVEREP